jgi:hypothetical protein
MPRKRTILKSADTGQFATLAEEQAHPERTYRQAVSEDAALLDWLDANPDVRLEHDVQSGEWVLWESALAYVVHGRGATVRDAIRDAMKPPTDALTGPPDA